MDMGYKKISIETIRELPMALKEAADDISKRVIPSQKLDWDHIRGEIWEDSGRIILFPALTSSGERIDSAGSYIVCKEVVNRVQELDESTLSDSSHENEMNYLVSSIAKIVNSFFKANQQFQVRCFNQDGVQL